MGRLGQASLAVKVVSGWRMHGRSGTFQRAGGLEAVLHAGARWGWPGTHPSSKGLAFIGWTMEICHSS